MLVKNFRLGTRLVETRLFMRHTDGEWAGYTYEWNAQGTDATRVIGGKTRAGRRADLGVPERGAMPACHTEAAGRSLGLEMAQLNGAFTYPQTGRTANQVVTLNAIGLLSPAVTTAPSALPSMPNPFGTEGSLGRARGRICTPTAPSAIARTAERRPISTCATRRRSAAPTPAIARRRPGISALPMRG